MSSASPVRLRTGHLLALAVITLGVLVVPHPARADDQSISVNFAAATTAPTYRASGWIYGMTENGMNPPDRFFTDIKYQAMRAGGAQLAGGGWQGGGYDRRWNATRAQMLRTKALGGTFILLPHDLWGADGGGIPKFPGDNGNWNDYNTFLTRLITDVKATGVPVQWDIWNEPNLSIFWNRPQAQYFELWRRTYQRLRAEMPGTLIVGPSYAGVPTTNNGTWWSQYLDYVKANNAVPDIFSWHSLPSDPVANVAAANTSLNARGIPHTRPYQINEYGAPEEQNPGDGAWYISRLERAGADGLRANWASGGNLHNDLGNLLIHNSAGQYQTKGEWWVYRFYAGQTGTAVTTTPSVSYDAYATKDAGSAKVLIGGGSTTGTIAVNLQNLNSTTGLVANNQVRVQVHRIPDNNGGAVDGPTTVQDQIVTLTGNATTVNIAKNSVNDAYTVTVLPSSPPSSPPPSSPPSSAPPSSPPSAMPPVPGPGCGASYRVVNSWPGGFQADVTVSNTGAVGIGSWRVTWTLPSGQSISQVWNGSLTTSGGTATVTNASYNGGLPPGSSVAFGLIGSANSAAPPMLTCVPV